MFLILGLGNPGKQYELTRHNAGFLALDKLRETIGDFSAWQKSAKFNALMSEGKLGRERLLLAKPQTFMNNSGETAAMLAGFYKIRPEKILIIHDDLDLPLGKIKLQKNRGAAGHKGVQSIMAKLDARESVRLRLGIKPLAKTKKQSADLVLAKFSKSEQKFLKEMIEKAAHAAALAMSEGLDKAMNVFN